MKRHSLSIREEVDELAATLVAARQRTSTIEERLRAAEFGGSDSEAKRLRRELELEMSIAEDARKQLEAVQARVDAAAQKRAELNRAVFSLATGALALSVTFSDSLIPQQPQGLDLLRNAWVLLTVSVIAYPLSGMVELMDEIGFRPRWLTRFVMHLLPSIGFTTFAAGVLYFLRFALRNLPAQ